MARGHGGEASDVDLIVDLEPGRSLLDLAALHLELVDVLGREVDVGTPGGLRERIREQVLAEAVAL